MNEKYININKIAKIKGLKSTRSIRIAINKGKYIAQQITVNGGQSYEILCYKKGYTMDIFAMWKVIWTGR